MKVLAPIGDVQVVQWDVCSSTNALAADHLRQSANSSGAVILAEEQTQGRGRMGRSWTTVRGEDLAMSLAMPVVTPQAAGRMSEDAAVVNMALALDVLDALKATLAAADIDLSLRLKWPNDIVVFAQGTHRKLGGMLIEPQWAGPHLRGWVVGLGLNLHARHMHRPHQGVSLWEATGQTTPLLPLARAIAQRWLQQFATLGKAEPWPANDVLAAYHDALAFQHVPRTYERNGQAFAATLERVHRDGTADFVTPDGIRHRFNSSDIRGVLRDEDAGNQTG